MDVSALQPNLLELPAAGLPEGFVYRLELLSPAEESELAMRLAGLPLCEFEFHGYRGKRRAVSYGLRYDFADSKMHLAEAIPDFLLPLRDRAAAFAGLGPEVVEHALVTEYAPGAAIGWHRDRPVYGDVIGVSCLSPCRFRFRRRLDPHPDPPQLAGEGMHSAAISLPCRRGRVGVGVSRRGGWGRTSIVLEPRSAYLLRGPVRWEWEHSIPPAEELRYSVTFRTLRRP
jgi:alkylated DNA repair dioxygenase AlkB